MPDESSETILELRKFAHDLLNGLSSIYGYAQILQLTLEKSGSEQEKKIADSLAESVIKTSTMITERTEALKKTIVADQK